ncbi:MAG: ABC transporter substrate-binding protein [Dehalococcoidia bacterium]|nr:ABC transporter substrate-binding protein [Dehalococcoidia bacterium]
MAIVLAGNPADLDAQQGIGIDSHTVTAPAYNRLVQYDTETSSKVIPDLAERWEMSQDGKEYTFYLRQGVKFHNGDLFTADDAAFNLERLLSPPKGFRTKAAPVLGPGFEGVQIRDERTVVLRLKFPLAPTLPVLALDSAIIYPKRLVQAKGDMKTEVVGTGPFKFKSYTPSVGADLVKNPDYFIKGHPYLDAISLRIIPDASTRLAALRTGQVHMAARGFSTLTPSEVALLKSSVPDMQFFPAPSPLSPFFFMNIRRPPFSDIRVRKAISLALDRQAAIKVIAEGYGEVGKLVLFGDWGVPAKEVSSWPGWRQPKDQDLAEAKKLLADAGYPDGFDLDVLSRTNRITQTGAIFMTGQLQQMGIRAKVKVLEDAIFWETGGKAQHQAMVYTPGYSTPDPGSVLGTFYIPNGSLNFSGNDNDQRIKELNNAQMYALTETERRKVLQEAEVYVLREQLIGIPIVWPYSFIPVNSHVKGFIPGISDYVHNGNLLEVMWLAQ